jgi:hypothetical protein
MALEERKMIPTATLPYLSQAMMTEITQIGVILGVSTAGLLRLVFLAGAAELPDLDTEF